jgi:hypothetical protein
MRKIDIKKSMESTLLLKKYMKLFEVGIYEIITEYLIDKDTKSRTIHKLIFHLECPELARVLCDSFIKFQIRSRNVSR